MVLLDVGPLRRGGNGGQLTVTAAQRIQKRLSARGRAPYIRVAGDVELNRRNDAGRIAFERFGIGVVAIGVFQKDPITRADRGFTVSLRIKSKANSRSRIE